MTMDFDVPDAGLLETVTTGDVVHVTIERHGDSHYMVTELVPSEHEGHDMAADPEAIDHAEMDHSDMDHGDMDHGDMDHSGHTMPSDPDEPMDHSQHGPDQPIDHREMDHSDHDAESES